MISPSVHSGRARDESGAALIFALVFVVAVSVVLLAITTFADTSTRAGVATREERARLFLADGGIDGAIEAIRTREDVGRDGGDCGPITVTRSDGGDAIVECFGAIGSGEPIPQDGEELPYGILTMATGSEVGLELDGNNTELVVGAPVLSRSSIVVTDNGATLDVRSCAERSGGSCIRHAGAYQVEAAGSCDDEDQIITVRAGPDCNLGTDPPTYVNPVGFYGSPTEDPLRSVLDADPSTPDVAEVFPTATVAACPSSSSQRYISLPGDRHYTDADALNALTDVSGCPDALVHFGPGVHYFDFESSEQMWRVNAQSTSDRIDVVGGVPKNWSPPGVLTPEGTGARPTLGSAAQSEACDVGQDGALFVFGGTSRLKVNDASVFEVCGMDLDPAEDTLATDRVALVGLASGGVTGATCGQVEANASTWIAGTGADWNRGTPFIDDEGASTASKVFLDSATDTGFFEVEVPDTPGGGLPPGARLTGLDLIVRHREDPNKPTTVQPPTATVTGPTGTCTFAPFAASTSAFRTDTSAATDLGCLADFPDPAALQARWEVAINTNGSRTADVYLDGVRLVLHWDVPQYRAQPTCNASGNCAFVEVESLATGNRPPFTLRGTVYAPNGRLELDYKNNTEVRFPLGIIARSLYFKGVASADMDLGIQQDFIPRRGDRVVELFSTVGSEEVRALVRFEDDWESDPENPVVGRHVDVLEWSSVRDHSE